MIDFKQEAQDISKELVEFRRNFHMHPEASRTEFHTAETVAALLESLGIEVNRDYAGDLPSVVGLLKGGHDGPTVALRADMDALRLQEMNTFSYRSQNDGVMHACGHDNHMAMLLGAAKILNEVKEELSGDVRLVFQPAEETAVGALQMMKEHALDGVDCTCGAKGCWERYAATTALVRAAQEKNPDWKDGRAIFAAAEAGNETVLALLDHWTDEIAQGLAGMVHIFNPQLILIGGGVSAQQKLLIEPIAAKVKASVMPAFAEGLEVRAAQLHNDAGMVGAVYYFRQTMEKE